jgi:hypothetical protein
MRKPKKNNGKFKADIKLELDETLFDFDNLDFDKNFNIKEIKKPIDSTVVEVSIVTKKKGKKCQSNNLM